MISRRLLYILLLLAALLFQITNNNYLAPVLLSLSTALPLLSLLLSLPGMLTCRLQLAADPDAVSRGGPARWAVSIETRSSLPLPRLTARLESRNLLTGEVRRQKLSLSGQLRRKPLLRPADACHCGLLELRASRVRVYDYLGLFSLRRPLPEPARLLSCPIPTDPGPIQIPEGQGRLSTGARPQQRSLGEDYDLRTYRPGDPLRTVHWKLTSKWDELIVREPAEGCVSLPLFTFDCFGTPEQLDHTLDRLSGLCQTLLTAQRPHAVLWLDSGGHPQLHPISDPRDLNRCLLAISSVQASLSGPSILDRPQLIGSSGSGFHLHIGSQEGKCDE